MEISLVIDLDFLQNTVNGEIEWNLREQRYDVEADEGKSNDLLPRISTNCFELSTEYSLLVKGLRTPAKYRESSYVAVPMLDITGRIGRRLAAVEVSMEPSSSLIWSEILCTFASP